VAHFQDIFSDAILELYILWSQQTSTSNLLLAADDADGKQQQQRSQRSASIGVATPPPKPSKGIFRRTSASLEKVGSRHVIQYQLSSAVNLESQHA
jgi:hypothetical protein